MSPREPNERTETGWKVFLVLSGLLLVGLGIWQITLGNVGNGVGMIVVPVVVVSVLLFLIHRRGDRLR